MYVHSVVPNIINQAPATYDVHTYITLCQYIIHVCSHCAVERIAQCTHYTAVFECVSAFTAHSQLKKLLIDEKRDFR